jgi:hypothetical protein
MRPLGFVATDYALAVWGLNDMGASASPGEGRPSTDLFDEDMLGDDLEAWLDESFLLKRTFRYVRTDRRPDRQATSRPGEDRAAGDGLVRPRSTTCSARTSRIIS